MTSFGTVSNASGSQGLATGVADGATTITATDGLILGTAVLTVTSATLSSITVSPNPASIAAGETQQFTATGHYSNQTTADLTSSVSWSSSLTSVATESNASGSQGLATGVGPGGTTIEATDPGTGIEGTADLTVAMLTVTPSSGPSNAAVEIRGGEFPAGLTIKVKYDNGRGAHLICTATVAANGAFECSTTIENKKTIQMDQKRAGPVGPHLIVATGRKWRHHSATTVFTLTAPEQTTEQSQSQPAVGSRAGKVRTPRLRTHAGRIRRA